LTSKQISALIAAPALRFAQSTRLRRHERWSKTLNNGISFQDVRPKGWIFI
jgi:hypothetical protein